MSQIATTTDTQPDRPHAPMRTETFRAARPQIVGPDEPKSPYPITLSGPVQKGFGRGGKDLGCPTANLPEESLPQISSFVDTGVYFGYAQLSPHKDESLPTEDLEVLPMVMSLGYNPHYKNKNMSAEIHVMHEFKTDFYGYELKALVLGYIRPELDYTSREALIDDIETDKRVALNSLDRPGYRKFMKDPTFRMTS